MFLIVSLSGEIQIKPQFDNMFKANPIPEKIIRECRDWSGVDPYNQKQMNNMYNELLFMECIFYDTGNHEHSVL